MEFVATPAYIIKVGDDHTITLPKEIPPGAQISITVIASPVSEETRVAEQRLNDFAAMHRAIEAARLAEQTLPRISDTELDILVKKARKATREP